MALLGYTYIATCAAIHSDLKKVLSRNIARAIASGLLPPPPLTTTSTISMSPIGIPTKLLHESLGHVITVELRTGQTYRGKLFEAEDSLSISMTMCTVTHRDGRVTQLDQVYIRGPSVRFYVVPDMLAQAPMFKNLGPNAMKGRGIGTARGRATIMRAQSRRGRGGERGAKPGIRR